MKYFKCTNPKDPEDEFYISSTLKNETPAHIAFTLHLGTSGSQYQIVEVSAEEFIEETEELDELVDPKEIALHQLDEVRDLVTTLTTRVHLKGTVTEDELQELAELLYSLNKNIESI